MTTIVEVRENAFDPHLELRRYQQRFEHSGRFGATVSFIGSMRDMNDDMLVEAMLLEHYAGMTQRQLERMVQEADRRWDILDVVLLHRVGAMKPGDPIVLVAVWTAHRAAAFEACRYLIEELKTRAPFWKKETGTAGSRWVERNTPEI